MVSHMVFTDALVDWVPTCCSMHINVCLNMSRLKTTAMAHVACAPQESGILLTDFAAAYPSVNHSWIFHVLDKAELPRFNLSILAVNTDVDFAEAAQQAASYSQWRSTLSSDGSTTRSSQETLLFQTFFNTLRVPMLMILRWRLRLSGL